MMDTARVAHSLAQASAAMTRMHDVIGALDCVLAACREGLDVDEGAVLVASGGHLELLASSNHRTTDLEAYQIRADEGPCLLAYRQDASVQETGPTTLRDRWPLFGEAMVAADFRSVHASPLRAQDSPIGAMGLFRRSAAPFTPEEDEVAQAFADIAATLIIHAAELSTDELTRRLQDALEARIVIEQAKGVLAESRRLSMDEAYTTLLDQSHSRGLTLGAHAVNVVSEARRR
jgi:GAF domain-containing protein